MRSRVLIAVVMIAAGLMAGAVAMADRSDGKVTAVEEWSNWEGEVSCDGIPFDPLVAFARPANAEYGRLPSEVALRHHLAKTRHYYTHSPAHPWRLLVDNGRYAEFGRGDPSDGGIEVNAFRHGPKGWS